MSLGIWPGRLRPEGTKPTTLSVCDLRETLGHKQKGEERPLLSEGFCCFPTDWKKVEVKSMGVGSSEVSEALKKSNAMRKQAKNKRPMLERRVLA